MWSIVIAIIAVLVAIVCATHRIKVDTATKQLNDDLQKILISLQSKKEDLENDINKETDRLQSIQKAVQSSCDSQKELSQKAFVSYFEVLENDYKQKQSEYEMLCNNLNNAYSKQQDKILRELDECNAELDKVRQTRAAAIEAQRKEKEIREQLAFYCLTPTKAEIEDIEKLEHIKPDLHNARILSMLIWSTFFQKPMTALCNNILGTSVVCGIYKITNQKDNMCYIGQSVDIATRWKSHAKCGLGIDTPAANKLYKAMQAEGIWNFSWELLEECPREDLDDKERFYIELYQAYEYGYNSNNGISRR